MAMLDLDFAQPVNHKNQIIMWAVVRVAHGKSR
jgi:hypothetical protein